MMKLYTSLSTNNMHLFNEEEKLMKFENEKEIVDGYYPVRLTYYQKRKDYMIKSLTTELVSAFKQGKIYSRNARWKC